MNTPTPNEDVRRRRRRGTRAKPLRFGGPYYGVGVKLCSACLLGINCRYDGKNKLDKNVLELTKKELLVPVCPEQLAGLPTPREPSEIKNGRVFTISGKDITEQFERGAKETLKIAKVFGIKEAIFKQKSPSCGCGLIYDGSFCGRVTKGDGITTSLLKKNNIKVVSEEDL